METIDNIRKYITTVINEKSKPLGLLFLLYNNLLLCYHQIIRLIHRCTLNALYI